MAGLLRRTGVGAGEIGSVVDLPFAVIGRGPPIDFKHFLDRNEAGVLDEQ
jgi:hypothetical protein